MYGTSVVPEAATYGIATYLRVPAGNRADARVRAAECVATTRYHSNYYPQRLRVRSPRTYRALTSWLPNDGVVVSMSEIVSYPLKKGYKHG